MARGARRRASVGHGGRDPREQPGTRQRSAPALVELRGAAPAPHAPAPAGTGRPTWPHRCRPHPACSIGRTRVGRGGGRRRRRGRTGSIGPGAGGAAGSALAAPALPGGAAPPGPGLRPPGWVGLPQPPSSPDNVSATRPRPAALSKREPRRRGKRDAFRLPGADVGAAPAPAPAPAPGAVRSARLSIWS